MNNRIFILLSIVFVFLTISITLFVEKSYFSELKRNIIYLDTEIRKLKSDSDFERKKKILKIAKKLASTLDEDEIIYYDLSSKLQYYKEKSQKYFNPSLYGRSRITFDFSGDVTPKKLKEIYPNVYAIESKVLVNFDQEIPYLLLVESIGQFTSNEAVFLSQLKLSRERSNMTFTILSTIEK